MTAQDVRGALPRPSATTTGASPAPVAASGPPDSGRFPQGRGCRMTTPTPPEADHDERAVRLALAAGTANLALRRVREVLDQCTPEDRHRILAALGAPTEGA